MTDQRCGTCKYWEMKFTNKAAGIGMCTWPDAVKYPWWTAQVTSPVPTTGAEGAQCAAWEARQ
jgi:hypothetical protein